MTTVRIVKNWSRPDIFRQTPRSEGIWDGIRFTEEPLSHPDYLVVLNYSPETIVVTVSTDHVWCILQEPPNEYFRSWHRADRVYSRVFTTDSSVFGSRYIHDQPALPWLIDTSYDELIGLSRPPKTRVLSWVTSEKSFSHGHRLRMEFLKSMQGVFPYDLIGTYRYYEEGKTSTRYLRQQIRTRLARNGFSRVVEGKWEGLSPYRYSLAIENFHGPDYWSEKLTDCFLSWTFPIYSGCTNLSDYFPRDSFVQIDISDSSSIRKIRHIVESDLWEKRHDAILKARNLILRRYQFFPFLSRYIKTRDHTPQDVKTRVTIRGSRSMRRILRHTVSSLFAKMRYLRIPEK